MKTKALQVLLVEDNAGDVRLLREMFSKERPGSFEITHLLRMSEAEAHLAKGGVDIVLLDMGLPDEHGLDTVRRSLAAAPAVPVIVLTGLDDETLASEAMKGGAQDYLIKGQIENRARKQLQVRLRRKQGFGILHWILTAKPVQKPLPFGGFKNTLQRSEPIGLATLLPGKIPCDTEKIPFQCPLSGVKLSNRPGTYLFKNRHKYSLGQVFREGN